MRTIDALETFGADGCVLAMGKFDGVHLGHQVVLARAVEMAREAKVPACALTFDRNPLALLEPERAPATLTPFDRKQELIEAAGIDCLIVCEFTPALRAMEPEDFLALLMRSLGPVAMVCGENFVFGRGARGNATMLEALGAKMGFAAEVLPLCEIDGDAASSTRIRALIRDGNFGAAGRLTGRETVDGEV